MTSSGMVHPYDPSVHQSEELLSAMRPQRAPIAYKLIYIDDPTGRLMCCRVRLSPSDFVIFRRPGRKNQVADAVSRQTRPSEPEYPL